MQDAHNVHKLEVRQFTRLFREEGIDKIPERLEILRVFLNTEEHITSRRLIELLHDAGHDFDPDFVRQTLRLLCRYGFAMKRDFKGRRSVYEHRHLGQHHDHLICTKCGSITEFVHDGLERAQVDAAASYGFHMLQHRLEIYGLCPECFKKRTPYMPLAMAKAGEKALVRNFAGGSRAKLRLVSIGLRLGDEIEVITSDGKGQVVISVEGKRLALGRGLAQKILVEPRT